jgi:thioesterase domain-containing protein
VALAVLLKAPTIERLAAVLREETSQDEFAYAVAVQPEGKAPPFFCVGAGLLFRPLAMELGFSQPFFSLGLEPKALQRLNASLESLSTHLVSAMRAKQPQGPYYLGGFCQDGVFAYEIARQLIDQGQEVGLLALFETVNPSPNVGFRKMSGLKRTIMKLRRKLHLLTQLPGAGVSDRTRVQIEELKQTLTRARWRVSNHLRFGGRRPAPEDLERMQYLAAIAYKPKPLACPTILFRCERWPIASAGDPYFGWRDLLTGPTETCEVPGDHTGMFGDTNVKILAEQLRTCLHRSAQIDVNVHERVATGD